MVVSPYRHALVFGKFMPLHRGHLALIDHALEAADRVTVLVCASDHEPIAGALRLAWVRETLADRPRCAVEYCDDDLPAAAASSREVSRVWARYLSRRFPSVDLVVTSEDYGAYVAEYWGIAHADYDPARARHPVSGTQVRENPAAWWDDLPPAVRAHYVKKVCVYGAESTGKTTLAEGLARRYQTVWVPEVARELLGDRHCVAADMMPIAEAHARAIDERARMANRILFVDTDLITTRIYARHYFDMTLAVPPWIEAANTYDCYLLLDIDVPWVPDPQRDLGHERERFNDWFTRELVERQLPFVCIKGTWEERFAAACRAVDRLLAGRTTEAATAAGGRDRPGPPGGF